MERREIKLPKLTYVETHGYDVLETKKVGWLKRIINKFVVQPWCWLNGKKTLIGAVVLACGLIMGGQWGLVLKVLGTSLATVGGLHKVGKVTTKYGEKGEFGNKELSGLLNDLWITAVRMYNLIKAIVRQIKTLKGAEK